MWFSIVTMLMAAQVGDANTALTPNTAVRDYTVSAVSEPGRCRIVIHPNAPWSLKASTPLEAVLQAAQSVTLHSQALSEKDYVDPKAADKTLLVPYTATLSSLADLHVQAALNFFLCTDEVCQRFKHTADCKVVLAQAMP